MRGGAQQHAVAGPGGVLQRDGIAEGHAAGEAEVRHEGGQLLAHGQHPVLGQPGHGQQCPGQFGLLQLHGRVLEFGLLGAGAEGRGGQGVDAAR